MQRWGPEDRPRRTPEAAFRRYEGNAVVVLPQGAEIKVLNPCGSLIFELLDGAHTVEDIVEAIRKEYQVEDLQARTDVLSFLQELDGNGMLVVGTGG